LSETLIHENPMFYFWPIFEPIFIMAICDTPKWPKRVFEKSLIGSLDTFCLIFEILENSLYTNLDIFYITFSQVFTFSALNSRHYFLKKFLREN
jgi:hypothetical protein